MFCFVAEEINFLVSSVKCSEMTRLLTVRCFFCLEVCFSTFCFAGLVLVLCLGVLSPCLAAPWCPSFAVTALPVASQS